MARLAWFTPFPPQRSGIAAYSAELLPLLAREHEVEVFVDGPAPLPAAGFAVRSAHDFPWLYRQRPHDLVVYQLGNAACHDYMWGYFPRYPGLVVLHDAQIHQARAGRLLQRRRQDDYLAELRFSHPEVPAGLGDLVVAGLGGSLFTFWPLLAVPARAARAVGVHGPWLAAWFEARFPGVAVEAIRMGVRDSHGDGPGRRAMLGIDPGDLLFAVVGRITPEKRIDAVLRAFAHVLTHFPAARLLLVGETTEYYDVRTAAGTMGVADRVEITGYVPDEVLDDYLAAADACLCLRWPGAGETSASWLRALAAGKPTVITERAQLSHVPALDPRSWNLLEAPPGLEADGASAERSAVAIAIDILDEEHSLKIAMRRLAADADLRRALGREARAFWAKGHTLPHMADDYRRAIARAVDRPAPDPSPLPAHLLDDGTGTARRLLDEVGARVDLLGW